MFECVSDVTDFYKRPNELLFGNKKLCNVFKNPLKMVLPSGRNNFGRLLDRRPNHIKTKKNRFISTEIFIVLEIIKIVYVLGFFELNWKYCRHRITCNLIIWNFSNFKNKRTAQKTFSFMTYFIYILVHAYFKINTNFWDKCIVTNPFKNKFWGNEKYPNILLNICQNGISSKCIFKYHNFVFL